MKCRKFVYDERLWFDIIEATAKFALGGLNVFTIGDGPRWAIPLAMVVKQPWKCEGCQPSDQIKIVEILMNKGADETILSDTGNTLLMDIAVAAHVPMFRYFLTRIWRQTCKIDLEQINNDGRNLYSICRCAREDMWGCQTGGSNLGNHVDSA